MADNLEIKLVDLIPIIGAETFYKRMERYGNNKAEEDWSRGDKVKSWGMLAYQSSCYLGAYKILYELADLI